MQYVILDLEWNSGFSKQIGGYFNEIIELGAVKLDETLHIIGQFSIFIRPAVLYRLNPNVRELTQITPEDLKRGANFNYAVNKFKKFAKECVIMSWSTADLDTLEANCRHYYKDEHIPFLQYYADVQEYFQAVHEPHSKNQTALQTAAEELGIPTDDIPLHRAIGDSLLTARVLQKIYDAERFAPFIRVVDDEFYRRLNFHVTYLCQYDNPLIDKSEMYFLCPVCEQVCEQADPWKVRTKAFHTVVACPVCGKRYNGRIQFKLCYDGVKVFKRLSEVKEDTSSAEETSPAEEDPTSGDAQ